MLLLYELLLLYYTARFWLKQQPVLMHCHAQNGGAVLGICVHMGACDAGAQSQAETQRDSCCGEGSVSRFPEHHATGKVHGSAFVLTPNFCLFIFNKVYLHRLICCSTSLVLT